MKSHKWFVEHREDFAIGALPPAEAASFRDHLVRCEECRAAVAECEADLAWLPLGVTPVAPPPGLARRLAAQVIDRPSPWARYRMPAVAAAALVAAGGWWQARTAADRLEIEIAQLRRQLVDRDQRLAATLDTLSSIQAANRVLQTRLRVSGREASLVVFERTSRHQWTVVVQGLPPAPAGQRYGLWFICEKGMRQGAALPSLDGSAVLLIDKPTDLGAVLSASVTLESEATQDGMPLAKREIGHLTL